MMPFFVCRIALDHRAPLPTEVGGTEMGIIPGCYNHALVKCVL